MTVQANLSLASVRLGGRAYPWRAEARCMVCRSPHRLEVEERTVAGDSWKSIADSLPDNSGLSERNLADHFRNGHLPVQDAAVVRLAEQQAEERGEVVEAGAAVVVSHLDFARAVVGRVRQRLVDGEIEPDLRDGLRATELLLRYEPVDEADQVAWTQAIMAYHDTAEQIMDPEAFQRFTQALSENPILSELVRRHESARSRP